MIRCLLTNHRYLYVGEQRTYHTFGYSIHNARCTRCGHTAHLSYEPWVGERP